MHTNAPCTKCNLENACEGKQMHQYQNATYMNALKCKSMQCHAADEECNRMECNEIVENASECNSMHWNAYGKKLHHFWEKTTLLPAWLRCLRSHGRARLDVSSGLCHSTIGASINSMVVQCQEHLSQLASSSLMNTARCADRRAAAIPGRVTARRS